MEIKAPKRIEHTREQSWIAPPEETFPLLCPVAEKEWVEGWDPIVVYSHSGVAEDDCVFITAGKETDDAVWVVTVYDPEAFRIEFVKIIPRVVATRIRISLERAGDGTRAQVTYRHTSLGEGGDRVLESFTEQAYDVMMTEWEEELNAYVRRQAARTRDGAGETTGRGGDSH